MKKLSVIAVGDVRLYATLFLNRMIIFLLLTVKFWKLGDIKHQRDIFASVKVRSLEAGLPQSGKSQESQEKIFQSGKVRKTPYSRDICIDFVALSI